MSELEAPLLWEGSDDDDDRPLEEVATGIEEEFDDPQLATQITEPFDPNLVRIESAPITIDLLLRRIKEKEINLAPAFQRKAGIWGGKTQSRLLESLLVRIPLPAFYFDATDDDLWLVVDGLQRLTALNRYVNEEAFALSELEFLTNFNGKKFSELPRPFQRRITESQVTAIRIQQGTPENVKFTMFRRINTGGMPLSTQEIRHALNQGVAPAYLARLAQSHEFRSATRGTIRDDRMADQECVLRFLAFTRNDPQNYKAGDFDEFLSTAMAALNSTSVSTLDALEQQFSRGLNLSADIFGKNAFRRIYPGKQRIPPINKALLEVWTVNLGALSHAEGKALLANVEALRADWLVLLGKREFEQAISVGTGNAARVRTRFRMVNDLIQEHCKCHD